MSSAYFAPLVLLPTVIDSPGRYRTRGGEIVIIDTAPTHIRHHAHDCFGTYEAEGIRDRWHRSGRIYAGMECENDIVGKDV